MKTSDLNDSLRNYLHSICSKRYGGPGGNRMSNHEANQRLIVIFLAKGNERRKFRDEDYEKKRFVPT